MRVCVGSKNQVKIDAVAETIKDYPMFTGAEVVGIDVKVELFGHPKSLDETVAGAIARAKQAFIDCTYSFGIESGLMAVPQTKTGFMETAVCVIFDGTNIHLGLSPSLEWPKKVTELILNGLDGSQAIREAGLTSHEKIGTVQGGIGIVTFGRVNRKDLTKPAIMMALVQIEHPAYKD